MADDFYKLSNPEFIIWMKNMLQVVEDNNAIAGIDPALITGSKTVRNTLETNLEEKQALEDNLSGKNQEIKFNRNDANKKAANIRAALKLNSNVPNSLVEQAGFNVDDGVKTSTPAVSPIDLVVTGFSNGINRLKWKGNGNKYGTIYIIEAKFGDSAEWVIVDVVKSTKFDHKNQSPGAKAQYRVKAKRGESVSTASNVAVIYG